MIVGVAGKKRAGKDTFAKPFFGAGFRQIRIADVIKRWCGEILLSYGYSLTEVRDYIDGDRKEEIIPDIGFSAREMMQFLGTWGRTIDPDLWVNMTLRPIAGSTDNFIITDIRRRNELDAVKSLNGIVFKIERNGLEDNEFSNHESETEIDELEVDEVIHNNGTVTDLNLVAKAIVAELLIEEHLSNGD